MPEKINKMPKFYMIFVRKIFFPNLRGNPLRPLPLSYPYVIVKALTNITRRTQ